MGRFAKGLRRDQGHKLLGKRPATEHPAIAEALAAGLPSSVDLSAFQPPIFDQGPTGSCTAHSSAGAIVTALAAAGRPLPFVPSPREIYAVTRALEGAWNSPGSNTLFDGGAELADVCTALGRYGVAPIGAHVDGRVSDVGPANVADQPDLFALEQAATTLVLGEYVAAPDSDIVAAALAAKVPVWVGFFCDMAFEELQPGQVAHAPNQADPKGGGHAVYLSGYSGSKGSRIFTLTNSWGSWCDGGKCLVSEAWLSATWSLYLMAVTVNGGAT